MKPNIVFEAPITASSGYGIHAREVAQYLCTEFTDIDKIFIDKEWLIITLPKFIRSTFITTIVHSKISTGREMPFLTSWPLSPFQSHSPVH